MTYQGTTSRSSSIYSDALDIHEPMDEATSSHTLRTPHNRSYPMFASLPVAYPIEQDSGGGGDVDGGELLEQNIGGDDEEVANNYEVLTRFESSTPRHGAGSGGPTNAMDVDDLMQVDDDEEMSSSAHATSTNPTNNCQRSSSEGTESRIGSLLLNRIIPSSSINESSGQSVSGSGSGSGSGSNSGLGPGSGSGSGSGSGVMPLTTSKPSAPMVDEKAQSELRRKIMEIQRDPNIDFGAKAGMIQKLMSSKWHAQQVSDQKDDSVDATEDDLKTTFYPCGHCIHSKCHEDYIKTSYQCPTCWKALGNMSGYYAKIDSLLAEQTMPAEYANIFSVVLCNDCEVKSEAPYHFLYHRCDKCKGYNTKVLETFKRVSNGQVQQVEVGAAVAEASNSGYANSGGESSGTVGSSLSSVPRSPLMDQNASGDMTIAGISGNSAP
ncbi:hypothetical protein BGZ82_006250 [Podila clonocystis]|nr:hypothetical protein BGZ82_006250 [Podila clonocystis]